MSANIRGITFAEQTVTPADDAIVRRAMLSDGILSGCNITYSGSTLTMAAGYVIACGRIFQITAAQNWAVVDATSGVARLVLTIDLTKTATETAFDQIGFNIEYASAENGFVNLTQDDINIAGVRYQVAVAVVSLGAGGITGIVSKLEKAESGGGVNFKVVPGLTQPGSATENTIWVETEKIAAYYFSATQPENMQEWDVWFPVSVSSQVAFNVLKKNTVEVYPIAAKQMIAGMLTDVTAMSYQGGAWVTWEIFFYKHGTFGVPFDEWKLTSHGVITHNADHILLTRTTETDSQIGWWTSEKIDLSQYSKIYAEVLCSNVGVSNVNGDWRFRFGAFSGKISSLKPATENMIAGTTFTRNETKTIYEVDISSVTDPCYIGIQGTGIAEVYRMWPE